MENKNNGLRKAFLWMMSMLCIIMGLTFSLASCGEQDEYEADQSMEVRKDTIIQPAKKGYEYETKLAHYPDSARKTQVWDRMVSKMEIWRTADTKRVEKVYDASADPLVEAHSVLSRQDYTIRPDQLDIRPISERVARVPAEAKDSTYTESIERDTVYYSFVDGQVFSIPIEITNKTVIVDHFLYTFAGVTFDHAEFVHLKNDLAMTRGLGDQVKTPYNTEYKANLYFRETNVGNPGIIKLPIYAFTKRTIVEDDAIVSLRLENDKLVLVDSTKSEF